MKALEEPLIAELQALAAEVAAEVAAAHDGGRDLGHIQGRGVGDVTFALDEGPERRIAAWAEAQACRAPLSVLTEDTGWRHLGPDGRGGWRALEGFDHGGRRFAFDPVDGTRPLMRGLRSAWFSVASAPAGAAAPTLGDVDRALLQELPPPGRARCQQWLAATTAGTPATWRASTTPTGALDTSLERHTVDRSPDFERQYLSFFRYHPRDRVALTTLEARFLERLGASGVDLDHVYEDQYTSNCAQLALVTGGTYRMIADLRAWLAAREGRAATATKPYDIAAAQLIARGAGAVVHDPAAGATAPLLARPIDATTPLSFVAYANAPTAERAAPLLAEVLAGWS